MCIPLHPYLVGHPYRFRAFAEALAYITGHERCGSPRGARSPMHINAHHTDAMIAHSSRAGRRPSHGRCPTNTCEYPLRRPGMDHDRYDWSIMPRAPLTAEWPERQRTSRCGSLPSGWYPLTLAPQPRRP